jgi:2-desacetyl-2-hydroxyethyl bacteriochlorophyllide A dehydrogenase
MTNTQKISATALWITGPRQSEIRATELDAPGKDDVLVRTLYSAISRGTELLVWRGNVPDSQATRMRAPFQAGDFPWPVCYGYITVGIVEDGDPTLIGRLVFCLHPHQTRFVVPRDAVRVLPDSLPAERAILAANMETAINAAWDAVPRVGDRITIIGAGTVGCLIGWLLARIPGTDVELVDLETARAPVAKALGLAFATPDEATADRDFVFHVTGNPSGLVRALDLVRAEGTIVEMSWYGTQPVTVPLGEAFHDRRIKIVSSQVGTLAIDRRGRWSHASRLDLALELLGDPALDILITGEDMFEDMPSVFEKLEAARDVLCHRIRY